MQPIISKNSRIRLPEALTVGAGSVIDDFCYLSTRVEIGICCHIASGCSIAGGGDFQFTMGDFSSLSSGVKVWCASNDFVNDLVVLLPRGIELETATPIQGNVTLGDYTGVGSNAVIMPDNEIPEGTVVGALSFVPARFSFEPWAVYAGTPIRRIASRNRENVLAQAAKLRAELK